MTATKRKRQFERGLLPSGRRRRTSRRGVLLLVVLSMLVLFMLIGTAFIMTSSQSETTARTMAKKDRLGNVATDLQFRALMQLLRDTENPASAAHTHSLLRDFYGTDGFQAVSNFGTYARQLPSPTPDLTLLGPTQGQLIDIYVKAAVLPVDVPGTPTVDESISSLSPEHVLKIDRDALGRPQVHDLSLTHGAYNGCLLTVTSGPAAGKSARIVDYEFVGADAFWRPARERNPPRQITPSSYAVFRFRVMAFGRRDGQSLTATPAAGVLPPTLAELAGVSFIVNGRPFNGTGVGYNPLAVPDQARLTALEIFPTSGSEGVGVELALLPNARYFNPLHALIGAAPGIPTPFATGIPLTAFAKLNDPFAATPFFNYPTYSGPGDADEGYDAADFQNMWLALQTVTPRSRGRIVQGTTAPVTLEIDDPAVDLTQFLRLDLEDVPLPSFHRPDLVNFWYHRLVMLISGGTPDDEHVLAVLQPYRSDGTPTPPLNAEQAYLITAIKRRIMMRPLREDHPNFDGGNPQSTIDYSSLTTLWNGQIAVPYWEAVGPWDVDNDNDGVPDSVWLDFGEPVQELEDGTRYKVLVAPLIVDLDSRLNVNAHGLVEHINPGSSNLALVQFIQRNGMLTNLVLGPNLAGGGLLATGAFITSNQLPQGLGMGPPEISLRPVFPVPWNASGNPDLNANRSELETENNGTPIDSYAALFAGRTKTDGTGVSGKYGYLSDGTMTDQTKVAAGMNYDITAPGWSSGTSPTGDTAAPDLAARLKFFDFPWVISQRTAYGTPADLMGRYALGLDYSGQPYYEVLYDINPAIKAAAPTAYGSNHLLVNSPYELDLSRTQRREVWSAMATDPTQTSATAFNRSLQQNDDAPFAVSDLERVLRAWDADAGSLPSRLWDVVSVFDPQKLLVDDPARVTGMAQATFNSTNAPELLTTAQLLAGINRRLVTTDSYDPPVPNIAVPDYMLTVPAKIASSLSVTPLQVQNYLRAINRKPPQTIAEILELRIRREMGYPPTPFDDYDPNGDHDLDYDPTAPDPRKLNALDPDWNTPAEQAARTARAAQISTAIQQLLAPELLAGKRMDINRPFGDGRDSDNDGVVDDPTEAGEPFLDVNGNGMRDDATTLPPNGEPFIDLDGNGEYTQPVDKVWEDLHQQGVLGEEIRFDYTRGQAPLTYGSSARVTNMMSQSRQIYARNLYCLMLLLIDENYLAPIDENDPQVKAYLDKSKGLAQAVQQNLTANGYPAAEVAAETDRIMARKLTCRMIAQWAVNCADMRDPDAIMTPFEYDENPWDGWGVMDGTTPVGINIPLDGDPATDENLGMIIDWANVDPTVPAQIKPITTIDAKFGATLPVALNQTRGVVWGTERPELLITETLAYHDRRTEDLDSDFTGKDMVNEGIIPGTPPEVADLDQRLRPRGSLFIEILNPSSPTGQSPIELYSQLTRPAPGDPPAAVGVQPSSGIELGRLSTMGINAAGQLSVDIDSDPTIAVATVKRSPVWRVAVVEELPSQRNTDNFDDSGSAVHSPGGPPPTGPFVATDIDWPTFNTQVITPDEPYVERSFYFTTDNSARYEKGSTPPDPVAPGSPARLGQNEFYLLVRNPEDKLRIPSPSQMASYFLAADSRHATLRVGSKIPDLSIAPIKPGRYALIGTAGAQYTGLETGQIQGYDANGNWIEIPTNPGVPRFVSTVSRLFIGGTAPERFTDDLNHKAELSRTRRIELLPHPNPDLQQVFIGSNGGIPIHPLVGPNGDDPVRRDNEVVKLPRNPPGLFLNIYDGDDDGRPSEFKSDNIPDPSLIPPCVAIPVAHMSVSEPVDLYRQRRADLYDIEKQQEANATSNSIPVNPKDHYWNPSAANGEGEYVTGSSETDDTESPYDEPFDTAPELLRNGTTRNYRTLHLQRLADPTLPWNPMPTLPDGSANPSHNPAIPVNVYRTIDTSSVDLTAFNGASSREPDDPNRSIVDQFARWLPDLDPTKMLNFENKFGERPLLDYKAGTVAPGDIHRWGLKSLERGVHRSALLTGGTELPIAPRELWRQEPESRFDPEDKPSTPLNTTDTLNWNSLANDAARQAELRKRANDLRLRDAREFNADIEAVENTFDGDFNTFPDALRPGGVSLTGVSTNPTHHFDLVMEHSLGFQNEAFGAVATTLDAMVRGLPVSAMGNPMPDGEFSRAALPPTFPANTQVNSTFPWFDWPNRPYISAQELLSVSPWSSSKVLRHFRTIHPTDSSDAAKNPYTNEVVAETTDWLPFGHRLNWFAVASGRTDDLDADRDGDATDEAPAAHFYRILDLVEVPSRFVGTETRLTAEVFNDSPVVPEPVGLDIATAQDPRINFQPPYNKVSRHRDPGKVNLNTVTGRRTINAAGVPQIWSEVFDGIMHRNQDGHPAGQLSHGGPAWRDVVLSRRGYFDTSTPSSDRAGSFPDVAATLLNPFSPTMFANPFRSPDAGDLVPLEAMKQAGPQAGFLRSHPYATVDPASPTPGAGWGVDNVDDNNDGLIDDAREAGVGNDTRTPLAAPAPPAPPPPPSSKPLFSENTSAPFMDGNRNPAMMYQPMTRLENLVTNRSNVFAIWITVGYFEVEPAPNWDLPEVQARFGGDGVAGSPATIAAQALYNRVYPDGYMLGKEVGSDTGNVRRPRGFFIVDRTEEVGFKPGEDLNVEKTIKVRRRIE